MKEDIMRRAIGNIESGLIEDADRRRAVKPAGKPFAKLGAAAAAFVIAVTAGIMLFPGVLRGNDTVAPPDSPSNGISDGGEIADPQGETALYSKYRYAVDKGRFASYVQGKVIADRYVGGKLEDVTVTAGWVYSNGGEFWKADEHARAEIYEIKGVSSDVAVAIRFTDKLEAELTDFYYVILNPEADLTPVQSYVIADTSLTQSDGDGRIPE